MGVEQILEHVAPLRRYARLLTAGNAARADDLVQDTLERACVKWSLWEPGTALRSWLLSMMHNLHLNQRRDDRHEDAHLPLDESYEPTHEPHQRLSQCLDFEHALAKLPLAWREVLLLVDVEEYSYAETAQLLSVPIGTVMSRLHRARETLRMQLAAPVVPEPMAPLRPSLKTISR